MSCYPSSWFKVFPDSRDSGLTYKPVAKVSCCPPNADKYLAANYDTTGKKVTLRSGNELYRSGSVGDSKKAVLIIPDVWGWNSGRTRNIADLFAEAGYLAVVPKLLGPGLQGGVDGDGFFPDFDFGNPEHAGIGFPYLGTFDWEGNLHAKIAEVVAYIKTEGATQIAGVGFCWGGWVLTHTLSSDLAKDFVAGAIAHPSVHIEAPLFQRDVNALFGAVKKPIILFTAKGDSTDYYPGGQWFETLKSHHPTSESHNYTEVDHGFVPRGDHSQPHVREAVDEVLARSFAFLAKHFV